MLDFDWLASLLGPSLTPVMLSWQPLRFKLVIVDQSFTGLDYKTLSLCACNVAGSCRRSWSHWWKPNSSCSTSITWSGLFYSASSRRGHAACSRFTHIHLVVILFQLHAFLTFRGFFDRALFICGLFSVTAAQQLQLRKQHQYRIRASFLTFTRLYCVYI